MGDDAAACEMTSVAPAELGAPRTAASRVRISQIGYRPNDPKHGSLADGSKQRLPWVLRDHAGQVVARGLTWVLGDDPASGDHVHEADFSCVTRPAFGYRLQIQADSSAPFAIAEDPYSELRREAFGYFYRHRSGAAINADLAGDERWQRAPGHPTDNAVGCHPHAPCTYQLDASGGWYGDGGMGKYTVGSALAVWTLQNLYERQVVLNKSDAALGDGALAIPEAGNGFPDVLDTARWHMEWMLRLQVPAEQRGAGLVHHKLHGDRTPTVGTDPADDPTPRALRSPTTAATLSLAAVAAQASRVWKQHDPEFAARCLTAAKQAYDAAGINPVLGASDIDLEGGRPYADDDVTDEAYWAAVELALATGERKYVEYVEGAPVHLKGPPPTDAGPPPILNWDTLYGAAMIDFALVPGPFEAEDTERMRGLLQSVADGYMGQVGSGGYRTTLQGRTYGNSTNFDLLRNAMVLTYVGDFTKQPRYRFAALTSLAWLMGRNPLGRSYVTGFGSNPVEHPHHVYWSEDPPPGMLVNGPNGELSDPVARNKLRGCSQQKCYVDDAEASSTNRVSDHGNAALAWLVTALAD